MAKRLTHTGSTLRPRPVGLQGDRSRPRSTRRSGRCSAARKVAPVIDIDRFRWPRAADAHGALEGGDHIGKIVLTV